MLRANSDRVRSVNDDALEKAEAALERAQAEMTVLEGEAMKALTGESKMDINIIAIPYDPMIRVSQGKAYILPLQIDGIQGIIEMGKDRVDDVAKKDKLSKGAYTCIISVVTGIKGGFC